MVEPDGFNESNVQGLMFNVHPNPAHAEITISGLPVTGCEVEIYNSLGEKIYSNTLTEKEFVLNTANFNSGIYLLKISSEGKISSGKIIVTHRK
jgi:hypothetical protein